jgi:2,4-dienoyl-CoA reductase-like NADH-dependent reductase (Old Yellow Enzyme family)
VGTLTIRNRFVRAGTAETMATDLGEVTSPLVRLYETLASHEVGLIFTGHMFVHPSGKASERQTGIYGDDLIAGLSRIPAAVHRHGGCIFAQISHAGTQSRVVEDLLGPSAEPNLLTSRVPQREATESDIWEAVEAFGSAARRAAEAGFDGVHIHGANGYLISSFGSPHSNRRTDGWGGSEEARSRFLIEIVNAVRSSVPAGFPVTVKLGFRDAVDGGLTLREAVERAALISKHGVAAVEVSSNLMAAAQDSAKKYIAVDRKRARRDLIFEDVVRIRAPEAYFSEFAVALKRRSPDTRVALVGGIRSLGTMRSLVAAGSADLLSMARPFIREPDLVQRLRTGTASLAACTSCNLCFERSGQFSVRCWRKPRYRLAHDALLRAMAALRKQ